MYTDRTNSIHILQQFGLNLKIIPDDFPRPEIGKSYSGVEYDKFKTEISKYKDLEQPGHSVIFGHNIFVWVTEDSIQLTVSGTKDDNHYEVTENDFKVCLDLEFKFDQLKMNPLINRKVDDSVCIISRAKYPELFKEKIYGLEWWKSLIKFRKKPIDNSEHE